MNWYIQHNPASELAPQFAITRIAASHKEQESLALATVGRGPTRRARLYRTHYALTGEILLRSSQAVVLRDNETIRRKIIRSTDLSPYQQYPNLCCAFEIIAHYTLLDTLLVFPAPLNQLQLPPSKLSVLVKKTGSATALITLRSASVQPGLRLSLDNATISQPVVNLLPGHPFTVETTLSEPLSAAQVRQALSWRRRDHEQTL